MKRIFLLFTLMLSSAVFSEQKNVIYNYVSLTDLDSKIIVKKKGGKKQVSIGSADFFVGVTTCESDDNFICLYGPGSINFAVPKNIDSYIPKDKDVGNASWAHNDLFFILQPQQGWISGDQKFKFCLKYNIWGKELDAYRVSSFRIKPGTESTYLEGYMGDFIWSPEHGLLAYTSFHGETCDKQNNNCDQILATHWLKGSCGFGAMKTCE